MRTPSPPTRCRSSCPAHIPVTCLDHFRLPCLVRLRLPCLVRLRVTCLVRLRVTCRMAPQVRRPADCRVHFRLTCVALPPSRGPRRSKRPADRSSRRDLPTKPASLARSSHRRRPQMATVRRVRSRARRRTGWPHRLPVPDCRPHRTPVLGRRRLTTWPSPATRSPRLPAPSWSRSRISTSLRRQSARMRSTGTLTR
jgi:hypothetical protein